MWNSSNYSIYSSIIKLYYLHRLFFVYRFINLLWKHQWNIHVITYVQFTSLFSGNIKCYVLVRLVFLVEFFRIFNILYLLLYLTLIIWVFMNLGNTCIFKKKLGQICILRKNNIVKIENLVEWTPYYNDFDKIYLINNCYSLFCVIIDNNCLKFVISK